MDALGDIETYRVQLEQVEAALVGEPGNEELVKLKADLLDIIALTEDLMGLSSSKKTGSTTKSPKEEEDEGDTETNTQNTPTTTGFTSLYDEDDDVKSTSTVKTPAVPEKKHIVGDIGGIVRRSDAPKVDIIDEKERLYRQQLQELKMLTVEWSPGEKCQALNSDTNQFNDAEVLCKGDGYLQIKFTDTSVIANVLLSDVRKQKKRRWGEVTTAPTPVEIKKAAHDKEKKKKKKMSKKQRQNEMEQAKEMEKKSWLKFMQGNKTAAKSAAGRKSIFASPDNFDGKIGIGTCGIAGKGMTSFTGPDKWKR